MARPKAPPLDKRARERAADKAKLEADIASGAVVVGPSHPERTPIHADPLKGQVWRGECNAAGCDARHAVFWHVAHFGLYCSTCAYTINRDAWGNPCVRVGEKPTLAEMDTYRSAAKIQLS